MRRTVYYNPKKNIFLIFHRDNYGTILGYGNFDGHSEYSIDTLRNRHPKNLGYFKIGYL